jgi:hypothetical protein
MACRRAIPELGANQFPGEALPIQSDIANELLFNLGRSGGSPEICQAIPIRIALKIAIGNEIPLCHYGKTKKEKKANPTKTHFLSTKL